MTFNTEIHKITISFQNLSWTPSNIEWIVFCKYFLIRKFLELKIDILVNTVRICEISFFRILFFLWVVFMTLVFCPRLRLKFIKKLLDKNDSECIKFYVIKLNSGFWKSFYQRKSIGTNSYISRWWLLGPLFWIELYGWFIRA